MQLAFEQAPRLVQFPDFDQPERRRSFDLMANLRMYQFDIDHFGQILPETREQVCNELLSQLAEGVDRAAQTTFVFDRDGDNLLYFKKGEWSSYRDMLKSGLTTSMEEAEVDPRKDFLVDWAVANVGQYNDMLALQPGQRKAWRSEYPFEVEKKYGAEFLQKECGLQPERQMGFLYVATCRKNGTIVLQSQTMDRSDSEAFAAALTVADQDPEADIEDMKKAYDGILKAKHNGQYFHAGRLDSEMGDNVWHQLKANAGLIDYCLDELEAMAKLVLPEYVLEPRVKKHIYGVWAYLSKQLEHANPDPVRRGIPANMVGQPTTQEGFAFVVRQAFNEFAEEGRIMAACGGSIEILAGEVNILNAPASAVFKAIFGSIDIGRPSDFDDLGDRNFKCPNGHDNYRKEYNEPEKKCHICKARVNCGGEIAEAA